MGVCVHACACACFQCCTYYTLQQCHSVKAGLLPGCYQPTAAVFVWWITNRVCFGYNFLCLDLTSSSRWWYWVEEFSFLVISEPVWWIKADVEVMRPKFPFLWQVIDLRSICRRRACLWTHVGGRWCPAVFWNSVAWCSYTEYKKKNEIWLLWLVDMFSEANAEERAKISVLCCANT